MVDGDRSRQHHLSLDIVNESQLLNADHRVNLNLGDNVVVGREPNVSERAGLRQGRAGTGYVSQEIFDDDGG